MAGGWGGPRCHFHHAKERLLLLAPQGPGPKGFSETPLVHTLLLTGLKC